MELRKVKFNLNEQNLNLGDVDYEDKDGFLEERSGYFHRWGDVIKYDPTLTHNIQKTVAIVEEKATGKVYEVAPHCVKFEDAAK